MKVNPTPHKGHKHVSPTSLPHFSQTHLSKKAQETKQTKKPKGSILLDNIYFFSCLPDFSTGYVA